MGFALDHIVLSTILFMSLLNISAAFTVEDGGIDKAAFAKNILQKINPYNYDYQNEKIKPTYMV